jgi:lipopolysaccharide transport system permease protein
MSIASLNAIHAHREVLSAWTFRTIRARYRQSFLGILWAVAQPLALVLIFSIVFGWFIPIDTGGHPYVLFSLVALVPWTFFAVSLTDMVGSLVDNMQLVSKIYFPREILPMAALLARSVDFVVSAGIVVVLLLFFQVPIFVGWLYLPLIVLIQVTLMLGLGLFGAAVNVFYRDVKHILDLVVRVLLYASPIIYPVSMVPEHLRSVYFLNPMAGIITAYRDVLLDQTVPGPYLMTAGLVSLAILLGGYWFFRYTEPNFADVI